MGIDASDRPLGSFRPRISSGSARPSQVVIERIVTTASTGPIRGDVISVGCTVWNDAAVFELPCRFDPLEVVNVSAEPALAFCPIDRVEDEKGFTPGFIATHIEDRLTELVVYADQRTRYRDNRCHPFSEVAAGAFEAAVIVVGPLCIAGGNQFFVASIDRRGEHSDELGECVFVKPSLDVNGGKRIRGAHSRSRGSNARCWRALAGRRDIRSLLRQANECCQHVFPARGRGRVGRLVDVGSLVP